ncbi:MAG: PorV/PorQ family protein [Saprospiraceae bacterium]
MNKNIFFILTLFVGLLATDTAQAGNPDRQGEAGAYELLLNPWARSAGLHSMTTSMITGVEAMRVNPAGLGRINKTEIQISYADYMRGTDISMNALGFAQKIGENGTFGLSIMALDFGDTEITTTLNPEGTGINYSPSFFNLGLAYAHVFENKVSVGILFRAVSETLSDLTAFGLAIDAGIQYVTGDQDQIKFGISLRNIGTPMTFSGEGLAFPTSNPDGDGNYQLTINNRAASYELPSALNIGGSYDILPAERHRVTLIANFTANSFSQDQIGGGLEYSFNEMFQVRGGYKYEVGQTAVGSEGGSIYSGLSAGATVKVPLSKENKNDLAIDYAYRQTNLFDDTHNIALRINL